jgi:hypothetical protein
MNRRSLSIALLVTGVVASASALAHHSFAAVYKSEESITIEGKVVQFQYRNPHSVLHVMATDASGAEKRWAVEWQGASQLSAAGISPQTVHPGDSVIVTGHPGRIAAENRILMLEIKRTTDDFSWKNNGSLN